MLARWRMGDGSVLTIACNLAAVAVSTAAAAGEALFESAGGAAAALASGTLPPHACVALLDPPAADGAPTEKDAR